jgi:hypothetical protein
MKHKKKSRPNFNQMIEKMSGRVDELIEMLSDGRSTLFVNEVLDSSDIFYFHLAQDVWKAKINAEISCLEKVINYQSLKNPPMTAEEDDIIKEYSFMKSQLLDIREYFICMSSDAKDNNLYALQRITECFITHLNFICYSMDDEDENKEVNQSLLDNCKN